MRTVIAITFMGLAAMSAWAQESTLPGGHTDPARGQRARYEAALRAQVDTMLEQWRRRAEKRDATWLADLYASNASLILTSGATFTGRGEIARFYAAFLPRIHDLKIDVRDFARDSNGYTASVQLGFTMPRRTGSAQETSLAMILLLSFDRDGHPAIVRQRMDDLPSLDQVVSIAGTGDDSIRVVANKIATRFAVRLRNGAGIGALGAHVTFAVTCGQATLSATDVQADADGVAAVDVSAEAQGLPVCVTARSDALPAEPVVFHLRLTTAPPP